MPAPGRCYRYFPAAQDRETLEHLLVGRQELLESLFNEADRASASGTPRFFLLVGPRGAGKSHLMSLLYRRIRDELSDRVIPVHLAGEEYSIFRASDFFLRVLAGWGSRPGM
ncbi:MAG: ATP-binding protein [Methanoculleus sp.]|nr:ATP-binding protein [Methanoculleus sp.]